MACHDVSVNFKLAYKAGVSAYFRVGLPVKVLVPLIEVRVLEIKELTLAIELFLLT